MPTQTHKIVATLYYGAFWERLQTAREKSSERVEYFDFAAAA
jgi:hypothetical protein